MPNLDSEIESVAKRFDELTDELDIPELLALSEELGKLSERAGRMQSNMADMESRYYQLQHDRDRGADPRRQRELEDALYRRDMLEFRATQAWPAPSFNPTKVIV